MPIRESYSIPTSFTDYKLKLYKNEQLQIVKAAFGLLKEYQFSPKEKFHSTKIIIRPTGGSWNPTTDNFKMDNYVRYTDLWASIGCAKRKYVEPGTGIWRGKYYYFTKSYIIRSTDCLSVWTARSTWFRTLRYMLRTDRNWDWLSHWISGCGSNLDYIYDCQSLTDLSFTNLKNVLSPGSDMGVKDNRSPWIIHCELG